MLVLGCRRGRCGVCEGVFARSRMCLVESGSVGCSRSGVHLTELVVFAVQPEKLRLRLASFRAAISSSETKNYGSAAQKMKYRFNILLLTG